MGSSHQTVLACGSLGAVRAAVAESGQRAVIRPVAERHSAMLHALGLDCTPLRQRFHEMS
ncbi:hypothetical protein [Catenuloplanes indicus]|uniref:Uncharacterized protein n=1 Tax=Catenuloplanes indicus TaxID=137267 RepID=A0AAE3VVT1_9ACTN|nr:hypothetical protein [Catenuloplanes indicus]MDQ0364644.1 hypothetical protein [Catenuloplanes indicus]